MTQTKDIAINVRLTLKQRIAWTLLNDKTTKELLFGGSAGGGKSHLGCTWLILNCLKYPNTRWLMGRAVLKTLRDTTLLTFFKICKDFNLVRDTDYKYNAMESKITFLKTGSEIYLKDLALNPSDPEFDELGSTEYTGVFIDEASQISPKAYNIVKTRIRYNLDLHNLIPKLLICSNPSKNFLYIDFYKPFKKDTLPVYRKFVPALADENQFISKYYTEGLRQLNDEVAKQRLLYGNWEFDELDNGLFNYNNILDMFGNKVENGTKYLSCDVAGMGKDKTVIIVWSGLNVDKILTYSKKTTKEIADILRKLSEELSIPYNRIVADEDGIGYGLVKGEMLGIKGFVNNSRQVERKYQTGGQKNSKILNYANLKSQCYWELANLVNTGKVGVNKNVSNEVKELLIEDLEQIRQKDIDKDGRLAVIGKDVIKQTIGRSTDYSDALMLRMIFELQEKPAEMYYNDDKPEKYDKHVNYDNGGEILSMGGRQSEFGNGDYYSGGY